MNDSTAERLEEMNKQRKVLITTTYNEMGIIIDTKAEEVTQPERTKGKWIHDGYDFPHGNDWIHCSICGKKGTNVPADLTNFCPNCGADMREEELDETD